MKAFARIVTAGLLLLMFAGCGQSVVVWQKLVDLGGDETATAIASDGSNYYVSFIRTSPDSSNVAGWFITKLDKNGQELWTRSYKDSPWAECQDLWCDSLGHLYAVGRTRVEGKELCLVCRYAPDGNIVWQKALSVGDKTWGMGICPVPGDKIAVCGAAGSDTNSDYMVAELEAGDGRTDWVKNYDLSLNDAGARIDCDPKGDLVVVGLRGDMTATADITLMMLKPNGDTLWTRRYDSGGNDVPGDVAFDPFGNLIATGTATISDSVRCVILEYDAAGGSIRKAAYGAQARATGRGIFITPDADIFMCGKLYTSRPAPGQKEPGKILVFQYKPEALSVWERQYSPGPDAEGVDLVVKGDVYVAANIKNKTDDVLVCRFARPVVPPQPAAR